jgi:hypothetical protein
VPPNEASKLTYRPNPRRPPEVVWWRIDNGTTAESAELLRSQYVLVHRFAEDPVATFLVLSPA